MPPTKLPVSVLAVLGLATVAACDGGDDDTGTGPCLSLPADSANDTDDSGDSGGDTESTALPELDASAARAKLRDAGIVPATPSTRPASEEP